MNPKFISGSSDYDYNDILELTSKGYSTREAKRKLKRDRKKLLRKKISK